MSTQTTFGAGPFTAGETYAGSDGKNYVWDGSCFLCKAPEPAEVIDEVWCEESEPTDPNVEFWIFNGITKTKNPDGQWVQTTPYGA